jgi:hypothetical protein
MIAAFVVTRSGRRAFQAFLIDLDARLQLGDCISTAFEYQQSGNESVFSDLLMQDATAKLRRLSTREIFPAEFSRLYFFLILMVITAGALFFNHYSISDFTPVSVDQNKIEKAKILVQDFIKSHLAVNRSKEAKENPVITRSIEQLRKTLNEPEINQERLFASLNRHLKEVQAEQARQAAELDARLDDANILNMPIQDSPDLQSLKAGQLEKLKKLLNQALNNQIPDGIHDNMESLQELFSLEMNFMKAILINRVWPIPGVINHQTPHTRKILQKKKMIPFSLKPPGRVRPMRRTGKRIFPAVRGPVSRRRITSMCLVKGGFLPGRLPKQAAQNPMAVKNQVPKLKKLQDPEFRIK